MLVRRGDRGEAVHDIQTRLLALGYAVAPAERAGTFGASTEEAVRAFQERRGLDVDGIVGPATWRELVEASLRLGDRILYLRAPPLRGDDVRALQDRLSALGFHGGRVDGIFGAETAGAVREFQRNYGHPVDGIVGDATLRALQGLPGIGGDTPVATVHEREALRRFPASLSGMRVVIDPGHGGSDAGLAGPGGLTEAAFAAELARRLDAALVAAGTSCYPTRDSGPAPSEGERARLANALGADVYLALHAARAERPEGGGARVCYYGHERFRSEAGRRIAELVGEELGRLGLEVGLHAKTFPVLRETRMPAVQIEPGTITNPADEARLADPAFLERVAAAITEALARFAAAPVPA